MSDQDNHFVELGFKGTQLFSYVGSKAKHLRKLYSLSPPINSYETLLVPFMGGGSFELNHPFSDVHYKEMNDKEKEKHDLRNLHYKTEQIMDELVKYSFILNDPNFDPDIPTSRRRVAAVNDLDKSIIDINRVFLFEPQRAMESIKYHLKSQAFFKFLLTYEPKNYFESAMRKLYLIFCSFGSKQTNWAYVINKLRDRDIAYDEKRLENIRRRLHNVFFFSEDFETFLNRYIKGSKRKIFSFLDPPYFNAGDKGYYTFDWKTREVHVRLLETLKRLDAKGHYFQLSYDNAPELVEMYEDSGFVVHKTSLRYTLKNQNFETKKDNELIITNYEEYAGEEYFDVDTSLNKTKIDKSLF